MPHLCIIADTHGKHRELTIPVCDILIHCGDFCRLHTDQHATLLDVDDWFAELPVEDIICVGGNHDFPLERGEFAFRNARFLTDEMIDVAGLTFYGSPWCPDLMGFAYFLEEKQLKKRWRRIPSGIDVLITHTPPRGVLDLSSSGVDHLGCPHLRDAVTRVKPKLHTFGHVHASFGSVQEGATRFINAAVVGGRDLEVRNPATEVVLSGPGSR
jgi:Icc-related predicted phosphoesterase